MNTTRTVHEPLQIIQSIHTHTHIFIFFSHVQVNLIKSDLIWTGVFCLLHSYSSSLSSSSSPLLHRSFQLRRMMEHLQIIYRRVLCSCMNLPHLCLILSFCICSTQLQTDDDDDECFSIIIAFLMMMQKSVLIARNEELWGCIYSAVLTVQTAPITRWSTGAGYDCWQVVGSPLLGWAPTCLQKVRNVPSHLLVSLQNSMPWSYGEEGIWSSFWFTLNLGLK